MQRLISQRKKSGDNKSSTCKSWYFQRACNSRSRVAVILDIKGRSHAYNLMIFMPPSTSFSTLMRVSLMFMTRFCRARDSMEIFDVSGMVRT